MARLLTSRVTLGALTVLLALLMVLGTVMTFVGGGSMEAKEGRGRRSKTFASGLFIETGALQRLLNQPKVVLVDARPPENYQVAHLPGAVNLPKAAFREQEDLTYKKEHGFAISPARARQLFGGAGIGSGTRVVVYDSVTFPDASIIWAILRYYGHQNVRVLQGGFEKWVGEGRPVSSASVRVKPGGFVPRPRPEKVATTRWLLKHRSRVVVLDMRSLEEYVGVNAAGNRRGGSIPGAVNIEWLELAGKSTIKSPAELARVLRPYRLSRGKEIVTYCNWGIGRSTYGALVLEALGFKKVRIYGGSMEDWSARSGLPVADSQTLGGGL